MPTAFPFPASLYPRERAELEAIDAQAVALGAEIIATGAIGAAEAKAGDPRLVAIGQMYANACGARNGTRQFFISQYRKLLEKHLKATTEIVGGEIVTTEDNPLDLVWERVNALGGRAGEYDDFGKGVIHAVDQALFIIEELGGSDPLPKRATRRGGHKAALALVEAE